MTRIRAFIGKHPRLATWIALAIGMLIILALAARNVGLLPAQYAALALLTVALAGACAWIIGWE